MDLILYYRLNFSLVQHHKWSLRDINDLYPFERDIYVEMLTAFIEEKTQQATKNEPLFEGMPYGQ